MKKLIGLVVILAVLILGSYYGMGLATERTLKKNIEVINQTNGMTVEVQQYHRGWFTSHAVLQWRLRVPARLVKNDSGQATMVAAKDYEIQMPFVIYHGPIIFADSHLRFGLGYAHSDLTMPQKYAEKFSATFTNDSTKPTINLNVFVNYLNNSRLVVNSPAFKLVAKQNGEQLEWSGMTSRIDVSSNMQSIDGSMTLNGASLIKNKMKAVLSKVSSDYNLQQSDTGLYLGKANISLPSFVVTEDQQQLLDIEQFNAQSSSDVSNGLFNAYFKTSVDKVVAVGKPYGPATLEIAIKNLDAEVLAKINEDVNRMQQGPDSQRQQALFALLPELPKLFAKGAQLEVSKLSLAMPEGLIEGQLSLSLPNGDAGNPFQLLQKVQGHGQLKVPAAVLKGLVLASTKQRLSSQQDPQQAVAQQIQKSTDPTSNQTDSNSAQDSQDQSKIVAVADIEQQAATQTDQKLAALVQVGALTLQGSEYVIDINLADGQLSINGKPFNPAMLQF